MKNVPNEIWLITGLDEADSVQDFNELDGVTWCDHQVNEGDILYIRVVRTERDTASKDGAKQAKL